jgi:SAM-dependent methyltransferase
VGIPKAVAKLLMKEGNERPFSGRVLSLGRQDIYFSNESLKRYASEVSFRLSEPPAISLHRHPTLKELGCMSDESFLLSVGFQQSETMDYSDFEEADHLFDLNSDTLPEHLLGRFDVIIDGGTIEHVFHVPNALKNVHKMLKVGGRVIHVVPSSNYLDHGFYSFSPTLFCDYYWANQYAIDRLQVFRHENKPGLHLLELSELPFEIYEYVPGCLDKISFGGLDDALYGTYVVARKLEKSRCDVVPSQRKFFEAWQRAQSEGLNLEDLPVSMKTAESELSELVAPEPIEQPSNLEDFAPTPAQPSALKRQIAGMVGPAIWGLASRVKYRVLTAVAAETPAVQAVAEPEAQYVEPIPTKGIPMPVVDRL